MPAYHNGNDATWLNMTCPICGKKFHLKPYLVKRDKNHYCSRKCHFQAKREYMSGTSNHQYGIRGKDNATWNGGRMMSRYGYWQVQCIGHPFGVGRSDYVLEHRLVAEKYLLTDENSVAIDGKRYLSPDYIVHHKNGIRTDNRPENLEVMQKGQHTKMHNIQNNKVRKRDTRGRFLPKADQTIAGFGSTGY